MKNLSNKFYESLTMTQRFSAAVAAIGRDDKSELNRLKKNSPDGEYVIDKLSAHLNDLNFLAVVIRLTLYEQLGNWLLAQTIDGQMSESDHSVTVQVINKALEETASVIVARDQWLDEIGIPMEDFTAFDGPQPGLIEELIKRSKGREAPHTIELYKTAFADFFQNRHPAMRSS